MQRSVALPIEQQVNGVQSMLYMQSTSTADGNYALTVTFAIGTDLDQAQVLVQNRVQSVIASLPQAVQAQGVTVQKRSTAILQIIALTSTDPRHDSLYLSNYAIINMRDVLTRVPGVGNINVFGAGQYAMRVWLDPERLRARGLTVQDVTQDLQQQNMDVTAGQFGMSPAPADQARQYTLVVAGRLSDVSAFENVILKVANGAVTRLRDVGRVELGAQSYGQAFTLGRQARRRPRRVPVAGRQCARRRHRRPRRRCTTCSAASRSASPPPSRSTPPCSSAPRSTRSTPP